jgi:hypothetical protein
LVAVVVGQDTHQTLEQMAVLVVAGVMVVQLVLEILLLPHLLKEIMVGLDQVPQILIPAAAVVAHLQQVRQEILA